MTPIRGNIFLSRQPAPDLNFDHIRNSSKVVIDAYNGTVNLYLIEPADPIAANYQRIFPGLFKPSRHPTHLIHARLYQTY